MMSAVYLDWLFATLAPVVFAAMAVVAVPLILFLFVSSFQGVTGDE